MSKANKFVKNDAGFTGLEAAIVLIAFVVVAAVFSYVMLGAGFFTSEKAKQTVHTGVDMATSSVQTSGDIIGTGSTDGKTVTDIAVTLQLTAGQSPIDLSKTIVSFQDNNQYVAKAYDGATDATVNTKTIWLHSNDATANSLIEPGELV
ncbi:MAG TPA: archaellin/type IV pilin N-terminal domain-containing protein, partial [Methanocella sp.]|uniref:archaellin/type IV pilin N-terminal domain-containing protein n=1 Tax=Methanocella sp. TaxID=2052833 RepID=UPI002BD33C53